MTRPRANLDVRALARRVHLWLGLSLGVLLAGPAAEKIVPGIMTGGLVILWIAALLTLWTGYDYLKAGVVHAMGR